MERIASCRRGAFVKFLPDRQIVASLTNWPAGQHTPARKSENATFVPSSFGRRKSAQLTDTGHGVCGSAITSSKLKLTFLRATSNLGVALSAWAKPTSDPSRCLAEHPSPRIVRARKPRLHPAGRRDRDAGGERRRSRRPGVAFVTSIVFLRLAAQRNQAERHHERGAEPVRCSATLAHRFLQCCSRLRGLTPLTSNHSVERAPHPVPLPIRMGRGSSAPRAADGH